MSDSFKSYFSNSYLDLLEDAAVLPEQRGRIALTTDSYVVRPIFFPGGDIGKLAVCGTVNDLSMVGANPLYITAGYILEEGLPYSDLEKIVSSMAETAAAAGVKVVAGDTKVVERGSADKIFINTAGVGWLREGVDLSPQKCPAWRQDPDLRNHRGPWDGHPFPEGRIGIWHLSCQRLCAPQRARPGDAGPAS